MRRCHRVGSITHQSDEASDPVAACAAEHKGDRVRKKRTRVPEEELALLAGEPPADWPGAWFRERLLAVYRGLAAENPG